MRLKKDFYNRPTLKVAQDLLGKFLVRKIKDRKIAAMITETEAYIGEKDLASHARFGPTKRNAVMYGHAGVWYVHLIYGMYWMLNVITEGHGSPAGILIRGVITEEGEKLNGPGKLTRGMKINKTFNLKSVSAGDLWIEDRGIKIPLRKIKKTPRIGIDYAEEYKDKLWRFVLEE